MRHIKTTVKRSWRRYLSDTTAAFALSLVLSMPALFGAAGMAVDLAKAYNMKARLGNALDKAALAAGSTSGDQDDVEERVERFMEVNYPESRLGAAYDVEVHLVDGYVTVSAHARVETTFMAIFGESYREFDVYEQVIVRRELSGVEAVLVLDVSGSMEGSNLRALKRASDNFLDIMFSRISDIEFLRVGIVPFSMSVNVGRYGLGQNPDGTSYGTAFVNYPSSDQYVNPASNIKYGTSNSRWLGCIVERSPPDDVNDDPSPNWSMYRYTKSGSNNNANLYCNSSTVVPLTNNKATLEASVDGLNANGGTYINVGAVWGHRVLSPPEPFTGGVAYDDPDWTKAVIIMTDGDNSVYNQYSSYGAYPGLSNNDLNDKLLDVCANMKADGITVYTVTFQSGINNATKTLFRNCATDRDKYYDAPSDTELVQAFERIANELSSLHIVQ